jgi:hypothetical protein
MRIPTFLLFGLLLQYAAALTAQKRQVVIPLPQQAMEAQQEAPPVVLKSCCSTLSNELRGATNDARLAGVCRIALDATIDYVAMAAGAPTIAFTNVISVTEVVTTTVTATETTTQKIVPSESDTRLADLRKRNWEREAVAGEEMCPCRVTTVELVSFHIETVP